MKKLMIATAIFGLTITSFAAPSVAAPIVPNIQIGNSIAATEVGYRKKSSKRHYRSSILQPHQITRSLYRQGYKNVKGVRYSRGYYTAKAFGYRGPVKLTISARSGHVIKRERLSNRRSHDRSGVRFGGHRGGWSWSYTIR